MLLLFIVIETFLNNRTFHVIVRLVKRDIKCGVLQGSVLIPLLFDLYITDLCSLMDSDLLTMSSVPFTK